MGGEASSPSRTPGQPPLSSATGGRASPRAVPVQPRPPPKKGPAGTFAALPRAPASPGGAPRLRPACRCRQGRDHRAGLACSIPLAALCATSAPEIRLNSSQALNATTTNENRCCYDSIHCCRCGSKQVAGVDAVVAVDTVGVEFSQQQHNIGQWLIEGAFGY